MPLRGNISIHRLHSIQDEISHFITTRPDSKLLMHCLQCRVVVSTMLNFLSRYRFYSGNNVAEQEEKPTYAVRFTADTLFVFAKKKIRLRCCTVPSLLMLRNNTGNLRAYAISSQRRKSHRLGIELYFQCKKKHPDCSLLSFFFCTPTISFRQIISHFSAEIFLRTVEQNTLLPNSNPNSRRNFSYLIYIIINDDYWEVRVHRTVRHRHPER